MIGTELNLESTHLVHAVFQKETEEESIKFFTETASKLIDGYYPVMTGFLEGLQLQKKAHECKTIEELETLRYDLHPADMYKVLVDALNKNEDLTDTQRLFLLTKVNDNIVFSARQWTDIVMQQRAQRIAAEKPKILM